GFGTISPDTEYEVTAEDAERAGDDGQHVELGPGLAADKEGAQILDNLQNLEGTFGEAHLFELPGDNPRAVQHAHDASHCHHSCGIVQYSGHDAQERVSFQNRVLADNADVGTGGGRHARVFSVGPPCD